MLHEEEREREGRRRARGGVFLEAVFNTCFVTIKEVAIPFAVQVSIPEDAQRKNDPMKEEIVIPHTSTAPPAVGENRVKIAELDDIAQVAFRGTSALNRIQSVAFDAAYYSNGNLLISAPTGAGKTNIAMLTVLREIKNNIVDGVIKRDNFKVCTIVTWPVF